MDSAQDIEVPQPKKFKLTASLIATVFILIAIPTTVAATVFVRQVNPRASTNPFAADGLTSSPSGSCIPDTSRPGLYKTMVNFRWNPATYAYASDIQYLDIGVDSNFSSGTFYGTNITGKTSFSAAVNKEQTLYWRVNTRYTNGVWASSAAATVNNNCVIVDTQAPSAPTGLQVVPPTIAGPKVDIYWNKSTDNVAVARYDIYRTVDGVSPQVVSVLASATQKNLLLTDYFFEDTGLKFGLRYSYYIQAVDTSGNKSIPSVSAGPTTMYTDTDKDGFYDAQEAYMLTIQNQACGGNAWPPDLNNDKVVNSLDLSIEARYVGTSENGPANSNGSFYNRRYDLDANGKIDSADQNIIASYFGKTCQ